MKCKNCNDLDCSYRTSDAEKQCVYEHFTEQVNNTNTIDNYDFIRANAAIAFGQALINNSSMMYKSCEDVAMLAVDYADALVKVLKLTK